jgi:hypothetical protein
LGAHLMPCDHNCRLGDLGRKAAGLFRSFATSLTGVCALAQAARNLPRIYGVSRSVHFARVVMACILLVDGNAWSQRKPVLSTPEALAGRWEWPDGQGGAAGMNVIVNTHIDGAADRIAGRVQYEDEVLFGLYYRAGSEVEPLGFNFFRNSPGEGVLWDGRRLAIHLGGKAGIPNVNVDLIWHEESQTWSGLFERAAFHKHVLLKRPASAAGTSASPFIGTWMDPRAMMNNCLHIAQQPDGALTAWSDDLQTPGRMRYANGIKPPLQTFEHYGEVAKATVDKSGQITVELRAYSPACCSHSFTARLSADGQSLSGVWAEGPNQSSRAAEWKKIPGLSCVAGDNLGTR